LAVSAAQEISVVVVDGLIEQPVQCSTIKTQFDEVLGASGNLVAVSGPLNCRDDGTLYGIDFDELVVFPDRTELPGSEDVKGILSTV